MKVLAELTPFLSNHKLAITAVAVMLLFNGALVILTGFAASYIVDGLPDNQQDAHEFLDVSLKYSIIAIFVMALLRYMHSCILVRVAAKVTEAIRSRVFNNITDQNLAYFDRQHSGDMQTRIVSDVNVVGQFISSQIPVNLSSSVKLIGGLAGAAIVSVKLTVAVVVALPLLFLPFFVVAKPIRNVAKFVQSATSDVGTFAGESFRNVKIVQAYNKKVEEKRRFSELAGIVVEGTMRRARLEQAVGALINAFALLGTAILLWVCAKSIYQGNMSTGQLVSFGYFVYLIVTAASKFVNFISAMNSVIGSAEKIVEYLKLEKQSWSKRHGEFNGNGQIKFNDIYFSYPNRSDTQVLHGINLSIDAGAHVTVVGPSGAGKSTLFELLLRFYELKHGVVTIDGTNIKELDLDQLRNAIGFVPQKENLISGTVLDNICYGIDNADETKAREVAEKVGVDEFIKQLPNGYKTDLGEVGGRLSGGQKQRISLARALLRNPKILLLDEANSALDVESDRYIAKSIKVWAKEHGATVITIAHRLETAKQADSIIVMDRGRVVSEGKHEELLEKCAIYQTLSFGEEEVEVDGFALEAC